MSNGSDDDAPLSAELLPAPHPRQGSLFAEGFEVRADALDALARLDVGRALECLARARATGARDAEIDELEGALRWLEPQAAHGSLGGDDAARIFLALPSACRAGAVSRVGVAFLDEAIARFALRGAQASREYLDTDRCVHSAALLLARNHPERALVRVRASLKAGDDQRADLWGYLGDARVMLHDVDGIDEAFVRALVLDARAVDFFRMRHEHLRALFERLLAAHPEPEARELVLPHAWIMGLLNIPRANTWLQRDLARLREETVIDARAPARQRRRVFSLLLYLDRSRARNDCALDERQTMRELDPELFAQYMQRSQRLDAAARSGA